MLVILVVLALRLLRQFAQLLLGLPQISLQLRNSLVLLLSGGGLFYRATAANCGAALGGVLCSDPSHCCSEYGYCGIGAECKLVSLSRFTLLR